MSNGKIATTLRFDENYRDKLLIIAEKEVRSLNSQLEFAIKFYIREYEKVHGKIEIKKP